MKSWVELLLHALEPPHKNRYYFQWKLTPRNRNYMLLLTLAGAVAFWLSPELIPKQLKVIWNHPLQAGSEGPTLIF